MGTSPDLYIYYNSLEGVDYVAGLCSRWDVSNYSVTVETWLKKADFQTLQANTRPGAVAELYNILGKPRYYDKSWTGDNTLRLYPNYTPYSNLYNMRDDTIIYVKNLTSRPIAGNSGWIDVKIDGYISGSSL